MPRIRLLFATLMIAAALLFSAARAEYLHTEEFDAKAFAAAQSSGRGVLVAIGATWCPICSRQGAVLTRLANEPIYQDLLLLHVDYDAQPAVARTFRASEQGTLIGFRGTQEIGRLVGVTDEAAIRAFLNRIKA